MTKEKAIEKIKKLFALSQSSNGFEGKRAYDKAQELMLKYGISESEVYQKPPNGNNRNGKHTEQSKSKTKGKSQSYSRQESSSKNQQSDQANHKQYKSSSTRPPKNNTYGPFNPDPVLQQELDRSRNKLRDIFINLKNCSLDDKNQFNSLEASYYQEQQDYHRLLFKKIEELRPPFYKSEI